MIPLARKVTESQRGDGPCLQLCECWAQGYPVKRVSQEATSTRKREWLFLVHSGCCGLVVTLELGGYEGRDWPMLLALLLSALRLCPATAQEARIGGSGR